MLTGNSWLVTPSLYSKYYWYAIRDYGTTEDFLKVLRREKTPTTESQQAGIDFEDKIRAVCEGREEAKEGSIIEEIANFVKGGFWQVRVKREFDSNLLYGRADVITPSMIYDIKLTSSYDLGQYDYSIQHLLYMYCSGIPHFKYLISDGKRVYVEEHSWSNTSLDTLKSRIYEMLSFIECNKAFREVFNKNWSLVL